MSIILRNLHNPRMCFCKKNGGFTFLELMIVIGIVSLIIGGALQVFATLSRSYTTEGARTEAQQNVRTCIDFMARSIQLAGLDPLSTAGTGILIANPNTIRFKADLDIDGVAKDYTESDADDFEDVTFSFTGGVIQITDNHVTNENLLEDVSICEFKYYDANGVETTDLSLIRSVGITVEVTKPAGYGTRVVRSLSTRVRCYNL